jgi:hypothetical protein
LPPATEAVVAVAAAVSVAATIVSTATPLRLLTAATAATVAWMTATVSGWDVAAPRRLRDADSDDDSDGGVVVAAHAHSRRHYTVWSALRRHRRHCRRQCVRGGAADV